MNRFTELTEQKGIAPFLEFLEEPALIAYKAIETDKMVTLDAVFKEWISRYDPNMTPQRRSSTHTKAEVPQQQREKFKNSDKFNNKNSVLINELNSEINEIKDYSPVSIKDPVASINISLNNFLVEALIDYGANISIIAADTLKKIAKQSKHIEFLSEKNFIKIRNAQGNLLPVRD
uniref:Peptidase A2 domain-containing protein n=1 Tax=Strongyloides venezuelensis TaxID=75913 RepID=A0A0K0FS25_STRVS